MEYEKMFMDILGLLSGFLCLLRKLDGPKEWKWTAMSQNGRTGTIVYGLGPKMNGTVTVLPWVKKEFQSM